MLAGGDEGAARRDAHLQKQRGGREANAPGSYGALGGAARGYERYVHAAGGGSQDAPASGCGTEPGGESKCAGTAARDEPTAGATDEGEASYVMVNMSLRYKTNCCCAVCCECLQPFQAGSSIVLYGKGVGESWPRTCMLGPDWGCSVFTLLLIVAPSAIWLRGIAWPMGVSWAVLGCLSLALTLTFYCQTAFSDPGILPKAARLVETLDASAVPCSRCRVYRSAGTTHCAVCDVCVVGLDHHCPWTGKCIGHRTIGSFRLFLVMVFVHILIVFVAMFFWSTRLHQ